jgi:hypothetical protein
MEADREKVAWSPTLQQELLAILGPGCVRAAVTIGGKRRESDQGRRGPSGRLPAGVG